MEDQHRVLLVTFPGQGHINPSLQFAKRLLQMGVKIAFLTGDYALSRMKSAAPPPKGMTFQGFSDGLEASKCGRSFDELMDELERRGSEAVEEVIRSGIEKDQPFTRVIYTTLIPWAGRTAHALKVPSTLLWIQQGSVLDLYYYYFKGYGEAIRNHGNDPSWSIDLPGLPSLGVRDLPSFLVDLSNSTFALPLFEKHMDLLEAESNHKVLVNSFDELESEALRAVKNLNLVPIGPLIGSAFLDGNDPSDDSFEGDLLERSNGYLEWLNSKGRGSVIYVSFGSYSELPKDQMEEIAKGLIESGRPFLWVIRKSGDGGEGKEGEEGMEKGLFGGGELEKQGRIVGWCSQVEVLSHPSLGCFVSHCGWNSCLESLVCGVPLVCFPLWTDQCTNAKLVEDVWGAGIRVRKGEGGIVEGGEIKRCVEIVMGGGEEGKGVRRNADKWKHLARDAAKEGGSSSLNLRDFVDLEIRGPAQKD